MYREAADFGGAAVEGRCMCCIYLLLKVIENKQCFHFVGEARE